MRVPAGSVFLVILINVLSVFSARIGSQSANSEVIKHVIVQTTTGLVQGELGGVTPKFRRTWYRFRGIPFAEPPVGSLRFEVSLGVFDMTCSAWRVLSF